MPRDISPSSSEDEADKRATKSPEKQKRNEKPTKYQCPADFVSFCHKPCSSTLTESLKNNNNELWLIKAPANFKPECFSGLKVPLSGLKTLKVPAAAGGVQTGAGAQIYSVMASTHGTSGLCLLTGDQHDSDNQVFGPAFSGLLNVCENFGGSSATQAPQVIPAIPAPAIPPGLKQRFHPFGSKAPPMTCMEESEVDGASFGSLSTTPRPLKRSGEEHVEEEGRKKKKKKKKEKETEAEEADKYLQEIKVEPEADTQEEAMMVEEKKKKKKKKEKETEAEQADEYLKEIKVEPEADTQEEGMMVEEKKKKKKKKDRERVEVEEVTVKTEPIDSSCEDGAEGSGKKKKKKKKSKSRDD
ncbi:DNA-directed RNA polymerase I subunit RPA34 [Halichoeres trimaculatus]|uniref:DNA-directed RNA polymerase I subunit RPA34 n=1 Tax=Halichoeres trimaculatus TaxID=147232 RepID=UPI003D9E1374